MGLRLLDTVFDALPVGVVVLDDRAQVVLYNRAEEQLAGRERRNVVGRHFFEDVALCTNVVELGLDYRQRLRDGALQQELLFRFPRPHLDQPRDVRLQLGSFDFERRRYGLLVVEDVSAIRTVDRTKDFLVRMLAHDMNSPLTVIKATLDLVSGGGDPDAGDLSASAKYASKRLEDMVVNLFEITRLQNNDVPTRVRTHDLTELLQHTVRASRGLAIPRRVQVSLDAVPSLVADVDAELLRRAVENLLDNAIRFAPDGGRVGVRAAVEGDSAVVSVEDDGPGIDPELRRYVFEPFTRGDGGRGTHHHGLGLAFVDLVARQHGGTVAVECPASGGTVFTLRLPRVARRSPPA